MAPRSIVRHHDDVDEHVILSTTDVAHGNQSEAEHMNIGDIGLADEKQRILQMEVEEDDSGIFELLPIRAQVVDSRADATLTALQQIALHFGMYLPMAVMRRIAEKEGILYDGVGRNVDHEGLVTMLKRLGLIFHRRMTQDAEDLVRFTCYEIMQEHPVLTRVLSSSPSSSSSAPWVPVVGYRIQSALDREEERYREDVRKALYRRATSKSRVIVRPRKRSRRTQNQRIRRRDRAWHRSRPRNLMRREGQGRGSGFSKEGAEKVRRQRRRRLRDIFSAQKGTRMAPAKSKTHAERDRARRRRERKRGFFSRLFGNGAFQVEKRIRRIEIESKRVELLVNFATEGGGMYGDEVYHRYNAILAGGSSRSEPSALPIMASPTSPPTSLADQPRVLHLRSPAVCSERLDEERGAICLPRPLPETDITDDGMWLEEERRSRGKGEGGSHGAGPTKWEEEWRAEGWPAVAITGREDSFSFWGGEWQGIGWGREISSHREHEQLDLLQQQHYDMEEEKKQTGNPWVSVLMEEPLTGSRRAVTVHLRLNALKVGVRYQLMAIRGNGLEYKQRKVEMRRVRDWQRRERESFWGTPEFKIKDNRRKVWEGRAKRETLEIEDTTPLSPVHSQIYFVRRA